jgi:hypothetical protein
VTVETVDELFDGEHRRWNEQLVHQSFIGIDADEILKIQPSRTLPEDVATWSLERSGVYSIRSAYKLLKTDHLEQLAAKEGSGAASTGRYWWKLLSKLKIPPKVKVFWWRVIHGFLPCKAELHRRHI